MAQNIQARVAGLDQNTQSIILTRRLLACGALAGPLYVGVGLLQMLTRDGYNLVDHPLSLLSLGEWGWVQIANFVVTGLLYVACAVGLRRALHPGRAGTWGPPLVGLFGICMVVAGIFVADPALGFPPGTPDAVPDEMSWQGLVHSIAAGLAFPPLIVACFVFARRFWGLGRRGWTTYCVGTGLALLAPDAFFGHDWFNVVLALAGVAGWGWTSALAAQLMTEVGTDVDGRS